MKNYLFSGNINHKAKELLKKELVNAKVLVAIAADINTDKSDMYFYEGNEKYPSTVSIFKEISNIKTFKLLDKRITGKKTIEILKSADVIYLTGGDPFIQLNYIKDNNLDKIIKKFNGIIIGVSAGSMNQCKTAFCCKDEDYPETKVYNALGLVDITIDPHYDVKNKEQVSENKKWSKKVPIIGLPDNSFIVVDNGKVNIYGRNYKH